jgi:glycosyltransferase involved in cell wall biosynthesis
VDRTACDITVVITAHAEGTLAHRSVRSAFAAADYARARGADVELIAVLDSPNAATRDYFARYHQDRIRVDEVDFCDLGQARNHGVRLARGRWIAFLDADDLFGNSWLHRALLHGATLGGATTVLLPQAIVFFEGESLIQWLVPSHDPRYNPRIWVDQNHWMALVVAPRDLLLALPYTSAAAGGGFGYEDWHWFTCVLARKVPVLTVPETCLFVRRKRSDSLLSAHKKTAALLPPTPFLAPIQVRSWLDSHLATRNPRTATQHTAGATISCLWAMHDLAVRFAVWLARCVPVLEAPMIRTYRLLLGVRARMGLASKLPGWLLEQCRELHPIEPQLFPDNQFRVELREFRLQPPVVGEVYRQVSVQVEQRASHVFLIPWLKTGGADLETLNYARVVAEHPATTGLVLLATEDTASPWAGRLPPNARFVPFGQIARSLRETERRYLLAALLVQLGPRVIHNINSRLGYDVFLTYGTALRRVAQLYASAFCEDLTPEGKTVGYAFDQIPRCAGQLTAILSDNRHILDLMHKTFAIDERLGLVHYQPVELRDPARRGSRSDGLLQVMWAGRLDRQKRPDLLVEIARRCTRLPIQFHAYGASVLGRDPGGASFRRRPNLTYHGPFDGFDTIPTECSDLFLNTSQWEGLPNILLEALASGLPVISSDAGGIGELIRNGETGVLVSPFDDVDQYVRELELLCNNAGVLAELVERGRRLVGERHSWEAFRRAVAGTPGYLDQVGPAAEARCVAFPGRVARAIP